MAKFLELRRHTDNDDDVLSEEGVQAALEIGRRLEGPYDVAVSSGAQRATQTIACFLAGSGQHVAGGVVVEAELYSGLEQRWKDAVKQSGSAELSEVREVDAELVEREAETMGTAIRRILDAVPEGGRALVVGHSPTNEAAVFGLADEEIAPMEKGTGVLIAAEGGRHRIEAVK
jgi:broad specificity phosphatase PhoE